MVTGAGGVVTGSVIRHAGPSWEVHAVSGKPDLWRGPGLAWHTTNQFDAHPLARLFSSLRPRAVIHAAAIADIDYCQSHRQEARQVKGDVTLQLAEWCRRDGTRLVGVSTDNGFDGRKGAHVGTDTPARETCCEPPMLGLEEALDLIIPSSAASS